MKFKNLYITFILLILGIYSLNAMIIDSIKNHTFLIETELEESIDEISELNFEKQSSNSGSDNGGNTAISASSKNIKIFFFGQAKPKFLLSKEFLFESHLFILYCCLKLDC